MENNIIEADFTVVQERTLEVIATEIRTIDNHVCQVVLNGAVEIGQKLTEAKEKIGHGNWENWCSENLNYSKSKAERFMKIASEYGSEDSPYLSAISKTSTLTDLSISKALALLQVPENEAEDFTKNNDIDGMTVKELEEEIKKLKAEKQATDQQLENLDKLQNDLDMAKAEKEATYKLLQDLQEKQLKENNGELSEEAKAEILERQKEIDKLKQSLEKAKEKEKKLIAEKANMEAEKQSEIEKAKAAILEEATEVAVSRAQEQIDTKVKELTEKAEEALKRAATAEKNLEIAGSEALTKRKVNINLIGTLATEIVSAIAEVREKDPNQAAELSQKTKSFILKLVDLF
ncbi:MAG: DUF3102 domain-containing protein [Aminipila sp.]